jgi:hypothetical protein
MVGELFPGLHSSLGAGFYLLGLVNGRAAALVTRNLRDLAAAGEIFAIDVLRPAEALKRYRI